MKQMRMLGFVVGCLLLGLSTGVVAEDEPDWVFELWQPCWSIESFDYYEPNVDVPWDQVEWGVFHFHMDMGDWFRDEEFACTLSFGGVAHEIGMWSSNECEPEPGCFEHALVGSWSVYALAPSSGSAFRVGLSCGFPDGCADPSCFDGWCIFEGTLLLYAKETNVADGSWSVIKSRY
jgi:hypothetical protein